MALQVDVPPLRESLASATPRLRVRVLEGARLARGVRQGREQLWELQKAPLDEARQSLESIARRWDAVLERLKASSKGTEGLLLAETCTGRRVNS